MYSDIACGWQIGFTAFENFSLFCPETLHLDFPLNVPEMTCLGRICFKDLKRTDICDLTQSSSVALLNTMP